MCVLVLFLTFLKVGTAQEIPYKSMVLEEFIVVDSNNQRIPAIMYIADSNGKMRMVQYGYLNGKQLYFLRTIAPDDYLVIKTQKYEFYITGLYYKMSSETAALQVKFMGYPKPECVRLTNNGNAMYQIDMADLRPSIDCPAITHIWFINYIKTDFYGNRRKSKKSYLQHCYEKVKIIYN